MQVEAHPMALGRAGVRLGHQLNLAGNCSKAVENEERPSENRYDIQGFAAFDHGDPLFSNGWRGASLEYWWFL